MSIWQFIGKHPFRPGQEFYQSKTGHYVPHICTIPKGGFIAVLLPRHFPYAIENPATANSVTL